MPNVFFQDVLAEQNRQQDTDGGADEIKNVGVLELRVDNQVADAMRQLFYDYSSGSRQKSRRDAEYQHETAVGHVCRSPRIEAVNPLVYLFLKHVLVVLRRLK